MSEKNDGVCTSHSEKLRIAKKRLPPDMSEIALRGVSRNDLLRLAAAAAAHAAGKGSEDAAISFMLRAIGEIDQLSKEFPQCASRILTAAFELLAASNVLLSWNSLAEHDRQSATLRPLVKHNAAKSAAIERARDIATELWGADSAQEFHISSMAEQVEDILRREGFEELPKNERIKEWIKPTAPDYARKPGRRPKTS
ncbi:MAG: hypothetical protein NDI70_00845 [Pseudomonas sagittaria]|uniref:hypothetical protein n=1 Tax=Geopseudomonas sagittaria TaxID=1135990 RepID=UPI0011135C10|nr:hypothetical protein [Pseudomonas sagittaria]MCM2329817.1 hypothetical protein [Pseudomonas sagittaria]